MLLPPIIGDIIGSRFENSKQKAKSGFSLFHENCSFTDDTVLTLGVAKGLMKTTDLQDSSTASHKIKMELLTICNDYPDAGYGYEFKRKFLDSMQAPYHSCGNGAASRVSPVAYVAKNLDNVKLLSDAATQITHDHPEGMKGAQAVAVAIYLAKERETKKEIRKYIQQFYYTLHTIKEIQGNYKPTPLCQETVPLAIECFLEADSFEDAVRKAIMLGGDTDTLAAITGSIAGPYFGIPRWMKNKAMTYLDSQMKQIIWNFDDKFLT